MTVLRVLLADDHPLYRDGVARSLRDAGDIDIVGEAQDGESAAAMCVALRPDLVLLDISMPKGGGIGALGQIMQMETPPLVAMLTASEDEGDLMQALKLGALGYVLKGVGATELVELVRELAAGRSYVSPGLAGRLLLAMRGKGAAAEPNPLADLSRREEDILKLVAATRRSGAS
jgi:DNA-binding NarL/FixJ family response regulator